MSRINQNSRTKWWWLRVDHLKQWSVEERRASRALAFTFVGVLLFSFAATFVLLMVLNLRVAQGLVASIAVSIAVTIIYARGIANDIFSGVVQAGDAAAVNRIVGWTPEPTDESASPSLWWLDFKLTYRWSPEELWTRKVIFAIAAGLFLVPFHFEFQMLQAFGMSKRASAIALVLVVLPLALYLSRRLCVWIWPEYVKRADALACQRENKSKAQ